VAFAAIGELLGSPSESVEWKENLEILAGYIEKYAEGKGTPSSKGPRVPYGFYSGRRKEHARIDALMRLWFAGLPIRALYRPLPDEDASQSGMTRLRHSRIGSSQA
jgi:hypothetical protein